MWSKALFIVSCVLLLIAWITVALWLGTARL
jgi:hypothetical protein